MLPCWMTNLTSLVPSKLIKQDDICVTDQCGFLVNYFSETKGWIILFKFLSYLYNIKVYFMFIVWDESKSNLSQYKYFPHDYFCPKGDTWLSWLNQTEEKGGHHELGEMFFILCMENVNREVLWCGFCWQSS